VTKRVAVIGGLPDAGWAVSELAALGCNTAWICQDDLPDSPSVSGCQLYTRSRLASVSGYVGRFQLGLDTPGGWKGIEVAAIIVASGNQRVPLEDAVCLPLGPRVQSTFVLAQRLVEPRHISQIAPLQRQHILFALDLQGLSGKQVSVETLELALRTRRTWHCEVSVLYRELQVDSDQLESLTREMREEGIVFYRLVDEMPTVEENLVRVRHADGEVEGDLLVIPPPVSPRSDNAELASLLHISLGKDGYFQQVNVRSYRCGLSNRKGIYLAGRCHLDADDNGAQEDAAQVAASVAAWLNQEPLQPEQVVAYVDSAKCVRCLTCIRTCPHAAVELTNYGQVTAAKVIDLACFGCGECASNCPVRAISLQGADVPAWIQDAALI